MTVKVLRTTEPKFVIKFLVELFEAVSSRVSVFLGRRPRQYPPDWLGIREGLIIQSVYECMKASLCIIRLCVHSEQVLSWFL